MSFTCCVIIGAATRVAVNLHLGLEDDVGVLQ